ncbi:MAG: hypothetical protein GX074_03625 [Erysipelothrix sp.]|nr:hypothetical protein [Erysipelothrix sp.]
MDYKEILKKYWFAIVIGFALTFGLIYFISDTLKNQVNGLKNADGQDVVFSYNEEQYTADQLYDEVYETLGIGAVLPVFELEVYKDSTEITKAMQSDAKTQADLIVANLKSQVGENWKEALDTILIQQGYLTSTGEKGLEEYLLIELSREAVERAYILDNKELYEKYMSEESPRLVSHILVKMADADNPTEEETAKLEAVKKALGETGAVFSDVASEYSDDGSKENGGSLGMVTKTSNEQFVPEFRDLTYTIGTGETTEWFKTDYGYHIIRIDATTIEEFMELDNYDIFNAIFEENPKLRLDITWDQIQAQKITFGDDETLNKEIKEHYTGKGE